MEGRLAGADRHHQRSAVFATPQENDSTSISSLCLSSRDSPLMSPIFAKMSDAIWIHLTITSSKVDERETMKAAKN